MEYQDQGKACFNWVIWYRSSIKQSILEVPDKYLQLVLGGAGRGRRGRESERETESVQIQQTGKCCWKK